MRISDWSSDVCSSDLDKVPILLDLALLEQLCALAQRLQFGIEIPDFRHGAIPLCCSAATELVASQGPSPGRELKSVVSGKRVSVSSYLGGHLYIKKKYRDQVKTIMTQQLINE